MTREDTATTNPNDLAPTIVGHKIVSVEKLAAVADWGHQRGTITLDDGRTLLIEANEGCGGCSNGWYYLTELNGCDNVITRVEETEERLPDGEDAYRYTLYVYAENKRIAAAVVEGDDGNGYYGTGYRMRLLTDA